MKLDTALKGMFATQNKLRTPEGVMNPTFMSLQMARLAQYTGSVEEHLARYEKEYEEEFGRKRKEYMIDQKMKATPAEAMAEMELAETKGQVKYLTRLTASAWKQVGVIQSRHNHLVIESQTTNI